MLNMSSSLTDIKVFAYLSSPERCPRSGGWDIPRINDVFRQRFPTVRVISDWFAHQPVLICLLCCRLRKKWNNNYRSVVVIVYLCRYVFPGIQPDKSVEWYV